MKGTVEESKLPAVGLDVERSDTIVDNNSGKRAVVIFENVETRAVVVFALVVEDVVV